jgi:hypothetical protein
VDSSNWLKEVTECKIGNGMHTRFWRDVWIGDSLLCIKFPRLFSLSLQKDVCVGELLKVEDDRRWWNGGPSISMGGRKSEFTWGLT